MRNIIRRDEWEALDRAVHDAVKAAAIVLEDPRDAFGIEVAALRLHRLHHQVIGPIISARDDMEELCDHEILNVGVIQSHVECLESGNVSARRELIKNIRMYIWETIKRVGALKFWTEGVEIEPGPVSVNKFLKGGELSFSKFFEGSPSKGDVKFEIEPGLTAIMDENIVGTLLLNMCKNSKERGNANKMLIKAYSKNDKVIIEVHDDGDGIEPEIEERIFEFKFSGPARSTGIGLGDAEDRLETMDGKIKVYGHGGIDGGAKFVITLQAA